MVITVFEEVIRKHVLKNAFDYGKASARNVVGKVVAEFPDAKKDMTATLKAINAEITVVGKLTKLQIEKELKNYAFVGKIQEEKKLELPSAGERVVTRFLPEPNGYLHIGHAKAAFLSMECAATYRGEFFVRWDDTNPEAEKAEYVEAIRGDLKWLGVNFEKDYYTSDFMCVFYEKAAQLLRQGDAYVCQCSQEEIAKHREEQKLCKCRSNSAENLELWTKMKSREFDEGEAVVRLAGNMAALNTVMRDPTLLRVLKTPHYRCGARYCVWPNYDFAVCIADSLQGVTHALRSKEYELRDELYRYILEKLKMRKPVVYDFSRLNLQGTKLSKRFLLPLIKEKKVSGWDDPRLPTLAGLRRRGIQATAIKKFVLSFGLSKVESNPSWDALLAFNRKELVDSSHYFFVPEPVAVKVGGKTFYIAKEDAASLDVGETFRLKGSFNVKVAKKGAALVSGENAGTERVAGSRKLQWVDETAVKCDLLVPGTLFSENGSFNENSLVTRKGLCQKECLSLAEGATVQFERIGFARLDKKTKANCVFVYSC